jgi:hypothetical protein
MTARDDLLDTLDFTACVRLGATPEALIAAHRAEVLAEAAAPPVVASDRCGRCLCADCGGRLDQHGEGGCGCRACTSAPDLACTRFVPDPAIGYIASQLDPLLSSHLHEATRQRCLAVAHATHHALDDYDHQSAHTDNPKEQP